MLPPDLLKNIMPPPKNLFYKGVAIADWLELPRVAIVGSRKPTAYGKAVTLRMSRELAEQGVVITSGLAMGVDALAHQGALEGKGRTLAVLPSPLNNIVPSSNYRLAGLICETGGLISEYELGSLVHKQNFIARNRIVAALADAILITEAAERSGSLHTARFALEQGKDVLAVPGPINSVNSVGTNNLIKAGAIPVTSYIDVLHALGIDCTPIKAEVVGTNPLEQKIIEIMARGAKAGAEILAASGLETSAFSSVMIGLELRGQIRSLGGDNWSLN
jgi:DNA processing protein